MVFGTCCILINNQAENMEIKSVEINGFQRGLLFNFEITQTFVHTKQNPQDVSYIFPNDLKICIYDTTFVVGDEIIKPAIQQKEEAKKIYDEAVESGHTAVYGSNIHYGLTQFKLGNVKPHTPCKVILKIALTGQITKENSFFIKFPVDVYMPDGSVNCLGANLSNFLFQLQCEEEKIINVTSNIKNGNFNETAKMYSIKDRIVNRSNERSIIITLETKDQIESSALLTQANDQNGYSGCALTISPNIPITNEIRNTEFVFVVDCSGSMMGDSIQKAAECLEIFIKSLPPKSFFNVIRFGSKYEKLFENSVVYNDKNVDLATKLAQKLTADLGGTNILLPLESIFSEKNKHGQRQIFIMTDGEVNDVSEVLNLISSNTEKNRCFTIGIGRGCDAGLVEGMAKASGGNCDFVQEGDSISEKVIPQLKSSFNSSLTSVEIHIEGSDSFEISPFPIPSINANGSSVIYLRDKKEGVFENGILITGKCDKKQIELPIEKVEKLVNIEEDKYGCSKGQNISKCIIPLFAFQELQQYELKYNISEEEKAKAVEMSISSGVLCRYTAFVGFIEEDKNTQVVFQDLLDDIEQIDRITANLNCITCEANTLGCELRENIYCCKNDEKKSPKKSWFRNFFDKIFGRSDSSKPSNDNASSSNKISLGSSENSYQDEIEVPEHEPPCAQKQENHEDVPAENDLISIIRLQKIDGYWENLRDVQRVTGSKIDHIEGIELNDKNIEDFCIATIIAIAAIRIKYANERNSWILIEEKALSWLKNTLGDNFDIENAISKIIF